MSLITNQAIPWTHTAAAHQRYAGLSGKAPLSALFRDAAYGVRGSKKLQELKEKKKSKDKTTTTTTTTTTIVKQDPLPPPPTSSPSTVTDCL